MAQLKEKTIKTKNGLNVTLRSAKPDEGADLLATVKVIMSESKHLLTQADEFSITLEQETERIRAFLKYPDKIWILALVEGKIVGLMDFAAGEKRRNAHQGTLGISLLSQYCGLGIGRFLMEAFFDWAKENSHLECARLQVHAKNENAIRLYSKLGFVEEGRQLKGAKFADGSYDDVILMAREI
jgi:RimJ/RimL family protein N-acetyltransferase